MASTVETQPNSNTQQEVEEEEANYSYAHNLAMSVVIPLAMRTAVELDVFEIIERLYGISRVSKYFVSNEEGVSLAPFLLLPLQSVYLESWPKLRDAIIEGGTPFKMINGTHLFEYAAANPRFNQVYNKGVLNYTTVVMKKIIESYMGFEQFQQLVDVAGGVGVTLDLSTSK
ncbi:hypothetical protein EZV62_014851 [Acer yangbiense]|uniref:O-methyltransferase C-terminal domain-containing protein n=1 Tax=Acer yangbiense TaxID=1000413 RepID=A0A5C7HTV4_9ROSI|nr:hypothetical protein EZV62_014851 [Acer yangbiense]